MKGYLENVHQHFQLKKIIRQKNVICVKLSYNVHKRRWYLHVCCFQKLVKLWKCFPLHHSCATTKSEDSPHTSKYYKKKLRHQSGLPLQNPRAAHHSEIRPRFTAITGVGSGSSSKQSSEHWIVVYVVCRLSLLFPMWCAFAMWCTGWGTCCFTHCTQLSATFLARIVSSLCAWFNRVLFIPRRKIAGKEQ